MDGQQMQLGDWLDDLCVRFLINLPTGDLSSVERICFNAEEAHWYYEDFVRPTDASLPAMSLRTFCLAFFKHCPLLAQFSPAEHVAAFENFILYKQRVPVRGVILLNPEMDSTILVKGWKKGSSWSFPRGKIAKDEPDMTCAIREAWEETGLDVRAAGLVPDGAETKSIDITMKDSEIRLFIFRDVPMDTHFEPQTRKEISKIQWFKLSELPSFKKKGAQAKPDATPNVNKFFMVAPFVNPLKRWITTQKKMDAKKLAGSVYLNPAAPVDEDTVDSDYYSHQHVRSSEEPLAPEYLHHSANNQPPPYVQPSTAPSDKASALLSMLQPRASNAPVPQQYGMPQQQIPHTPQELTVGEPPQPRNPHHHTNQHQAAVHGNHPPPPFPIGQQAQQHSQPPAYNYYQQPQQRQDAVQKENLLQQFQAPRPNFQQAQANQAPLVHPQPLPPQVQRAVFNQSAFQDKSPDMPHAQVPQQPQPQQQLQQPQLAQQGHGQPANQPPQGQMAPPNNRSMPLNGQSMALLNAFKKDTSPSPSAQPAQPVQPPAQPQPQQDSVPNRNSQSMALLNAFKKDPGPSPSAQAVQPQVQPQQVPIPSQRSVYNQQPSAPQSIPQPRNQPSAGQLNVPTKYPHYGQSHGSQSGLLSELSASVEQKSAPRSSFSGSTPQQRSALLDMFKSKPADQGPRAPGSQTSAQGAGMEQQLPDTGHRAPVETAPKPAPQPAPQTTGQPGSSALSSLLAHRPHPQQANASKPRAHDTAPPVNRHTGATNGTAGQQPIRILQRGQGLDTLSTQQPSKPTSQASPYSNPSLPRTGSYASPPIAPSQPSPSMQPQGTPSDQKKSLLSLFGQKQAQPPKTVGNSASPSVVEAGSGSGTPARPGSSTPMSPAEQTFLLDYLQSVTNGAKR